MNIKNTKVVFNAMIGEKYCRKFEMNTDSFMDGIWKQFNKYAKSKGFNIMIEDRCYLGNMAWFNGSETMQLIKVELP